MHLDELEIHGFRAFPPEEHDALKFGGENSVIVGGNGTGKSSVLAAVEFLLTGGMTHLSGPGTQDIRVREHAPHINASRDECYVRGNFVTEEGNRGAFERRASAPRNLEKIEGDLESEDVEISQWNAHHLMLTRGQLLDFIEAPAGKRGDKLSNLLNLNGISNRTNGFEQIHSNLGNKVENSKEAIGRYLEDIEETLDLELSYPEDVEDPSEILSEVNNRLLNLDENEIDSMDELDGVVQSIELSTTPEEIDYFYQESTQNRLDAVIDWIEENNEDVMGLLDNLAQNLGELESAEQVNIQRMDFFEAAENLVTPETVECPLCGDRHGEGYLQEKVENARERLSHLKELRENVEEELENLQNRILSHIGEVSEVVEQLRQSDPDENHPEAVGYLNNLARYMESLKRLRDRLEDDVITERDDGTLEVSQISVENLEPEWSLGMSSVSNLYEYSEELEPLEEIAKSYGDLVTVRNAWKNLLDEAEALDAREGLRSDLEIVINLFEEAKSEVMDDLYSNIEESFNEYYTTIHPDEQEINLDFDAEGGESVDLEAGFEDRRDNPLAFHSEGHIDTMGICLFLSLRDQLDTSGPNIVMLDDIIMSVDKNHRRNVAWLLSDYLEGEVQGIISTHEEVWTDQLKRHGAVSRSKVFKIADWEVSVGPMMKGGSANPAWDVIEEYLEENKPHAAAAHLRRQAEKIGSNAAEKLRSQIPYKRRFTLGDYMKGINRRIKEVAVGTKKDYDQETEMWEKAKEMDDERRELLGNWRPEEMNPMVHYNREERGQLEAEDLKDVVEHWKNIEDFLYCDECQSMIQYSKDEGWKWIHCNCREIEVGFEE